MRIYLAQNILKRSSASLGLCLSFSAYAMGAKPAPAQQIQSPTSAQLDCRAQAPNDVEHVVVGFEGLAAFDPTDAATLRQLASPPPIVHQTSSPSSGELLWGMIAQGAMQVPNTTWLYYAQDAVSDSGLEDSVRCVYEYATKGYVTLSGKTVFPTLSILGFSFGGNAASQLLGQLQGLGIAANLVITADPRIKNLFGGSFAKPSTVGTWDNFYQTNTIFLNGYQVVGADLEVNLSGKGYQHGDMPGSDEVTADVRRRLQSLPLCRASLSDLHGETDCH